jgi:transposase
MTKGNFYSFRLEEAVPGDHAVRDSAAVLDLSWVYSELELFYPKIGRPSIDPVLIIRMLIICYVFAIRSEQPSDFNSASQRARPAVIAATVRAMPSGVVGPVERPP